MSSKISLQTPFVVAPLPRPIDRATGRYVVGDVYGGAVGSKKRKRSELAVGVDGEGVNIYDISDARLVTSYALPPQTTFTCSPSSLRTRISKKQVDRRTYVSTRGAHAQITLFHDVTTASGTDSSTVNRKLEQSTEPVVYMGTVSATGGSEVTADANDLLVVKENGEIQCFDGNNLAEKWTSPASALGRDAATPVTDARVEFAQLTNAYAASHGILKGRQGALALFTQDISEDGFNPDVLVIISKSKEPVPARHIHVVALPRKSATNELKRSIEPLLTAILPSSRQFQNSATFSVHASTGIIQQLTSTYLTTYDLSGAIPTEISQFKSKDIRSFLRLSSSSYMVSSSTTVTVYSSKYKSQLASITLPSEYISQKVNGLAGDMRSSPCSLVSYFPKLGTAVAIASAGLVAIQIEGKSRIDGLLIDSLGCSVRGQTRTGRGVSSSHKVGLTSIGSYLPGSMAATGVPSKLDMKAMDDAVSAGDVLQFETLLALKLPIANKDKANGEEESAETAAPLNPLGVDRRWVIYALSKIFAWSKFQGEYKLAIPFYPPKVFMWLLGTGYMTVANIESAVREQLQRSRVDFTPAGELVDAIVELDPEMDLLFALISANYLGAAELLCAIRRLMESLELLGESAATRQKMLTSGEEANLPNGDIEEQVAALEAEAEADLALAEYQLGPGSGVRGEALSLALSKLYTCPTSTIVYSLQTTYTNQEIVALIYLLRFEMARGAWTSRYLDDEQVDDVDNEMEVETGAPDSTIILISSLLSNCIDAVGAGGWLSGSARLVNSNRYEAEELISSLKLEVSAALEGLEEAAYLKGLTSDMVRYGEAVQKWGTELDGPPGKKQKTSHKPIMLPAPEPESKLLPLGSKAEGQVSLLRVGAGGEVHGRSARDIGRQKSQKVGKYSLERIVV